MLLDIVNTRYYEISIKDFCDELFKQFESLKRLNGARKFFSDYKQLLLMSYANQDTLVSPQTFEKTLNEFFQKPLIIGSQKVLLQFNISTMSSLIKKYSNPLVLSIDDLINKHLIEYSEEFGKSHSVYNDPILAVSLPYGEHKGFIADGNHRLTKHIERGEKNISVYVVPEGTSLVCLSSFFEQCVYGCIQDCNFILNNSLCRIDESCCKFKQTLNKMKLLR